MCVRVRARVFFLLFLLKSCANKPSGSGHEEPTDSNHKTGDKQLNQTLKVTYCHKKA